MATINDLYDEPGQAELVAGEIIRLPLMGALPGLVNGKIIHSLDEYVERNDLGYVFMGKLAYVVPKLSSGRESFSPDASFLAGERELTMKFIEGPPTFAVEVRVHEEYDDPHSEFDRAAKRADYFEAGTLVVWDVDPIGECIHCYRASDPQTPITFVRGQQADAETTVPGWRIDVSAIFA